MDESNITVEEYKTIIKAGLCTQLLHTESRIASLLGLGFYTIGGCDQMIKQFLSFRN